MRIVFMGTPEYGLRSLEALVQTGHQVVGVFTQPDKPRGRGGKVQAPPVKRYAQQQGIPVYQPRRIRQEGVEDLRRLAPELCVTAAFGQILSQQLLDIPRLGTVNVHASLLPQYRGSAPINWCLINGEKQTGVTTMMTDAGIDTGDILLQSTLNVLPGETAGELTLRLADLGAKVLLETVEALEHGHCPRRPQEEGLMSYYPMLRKEMGEISWEQDAVSLANLIHGLNPWPCASTDSPHGRLKLLRAAVEPGAESPAGCVVQADGRQGLLVATGDGLLRVVELQAPGGRAMPAGDYLRGHPMAVGSLLGADASEVRNSDHG
ncbi:MAG: methionyl-tRNA formyltransferase [Clostridiales bacterium]|nr:methionyl-tRNA formyltransferase [Clostridiales bacterium]